MIARLIRWSVANRFLVLLATVFLTAWGIFGLRATPIAEAMLAIVLMDHWLRHRAQNADVRSPTPVITNRP